MPVRKSLNHLPSSPVKVVEEEAPMKQGIVTILRSDCERSKAASIRRTLSADMSSKKWLAQNGFFSPMKKIVSSEVLVLPADSSSSSSEGEEEYDERPGPDDVWRSIQSQKERNEMQKPAQMDSWCSILTQKSENSLLPPPYVHPLVKTSASTLSEKSLEICTESLGSETGSDCFSSYCPSEILSDADEDKEDRQRVVREEFKDSDPFAHLHVAKYKKSPVRPFPPPLPSIAGGDGASLYMHSHRENGRLVLEAVSVPPKNYFQAQRTDGRLVLTLIHTPPTSVEENKVEEFEKVFDNMEEVDEDIQEEEMVHHGGGDDGYEEDVEEEEKLEGKEEEFVVEQNLSLPSGMISVHKSGLVMKKFMAVGNMNPTWSNKFNKALEANEVMTEEEEEEEEELPIPQSLPPPPRVARLIPSPPPPPAAASFNAYEYFWRNKTTVPGGFINPIITTPQPTHLKNKNHNNNNYYNNKVVNGTKAHEHQDLVLMKGHKAEYFVPYLRGCKEPRRSLLIWEPYCIATS
ncbi:hypothetical protein Pfo_007444 [Paulownia fortunei]|nr:hypothetical protein Pfo_007444 [Paulownia fortunei]